MVLLGFTFGHHDIMYKRDAIPTCISAPQGGFQASTKMSLMIADIIVFLSLLICLGSEYNEIKS